MDFENGSDCNGTPRRAEVEIVCGAEEYELQDVTESSTCNYVFKLGIPIPCTGNDGKNWETYSHNPDYTGPIVELASVEVAAGGVNTEATAVVADEALAEEVATDPDPAVEEAVCLGWRTTGGCKADGPRESWQDKDCSETITEGKSGYCECQGGQKAMEVGCEHKSFDCQTVCSTLFESVTASDEVLKLHAALTKLKLKIQDVRQQLDRE
jgi:hypothetical protein